MKIKFKHRIEYAALRTATFVANVMPEWLSYRAVAALGRLFFRCSKKRQRIALRMLRNAYPDRDERELLRIGRVATGNIFKVALDMLRLEKVTKDPSRIDTSEGERNMSQPPLFGLTIHMGSWEAAAVAIARIRGESHVVVQTFKNPLVQRFLERSRGAAGLKLHPRRGGIRGLARALEAGHVGLQAIDQNQRLRGLFVPFFGELASCERAAATLAVRKGYPVHIGAVVRTGVGFRFKLHVTAPLEYERTGDREQDVENLVRLLNRHSEELVLRYPEQYLWIHDRYRTRPPSD